MLRAAAKKATRRGARAVGAAELVDGDVGGRRVEPLGPGEQAPELARDRGCARSGCGIAASSGRSRRTSGTSSRRRAEGERRGQQARGCDPLGRAEAELERDPAAHRVADQVGAVDRRSRPCSARTACGEPEGVVGRRGRASPRSRTRAGRARGRCGRAASAATVSKNEALFEPRPCRQITCSGPAPAIRVVIRAVRRSRPRRCAAAGRGRRGGRKRPSKPSARSRSPRA